MPARSRVRDGTCLLLLLVPALVPWSVSPIQVFCLLEQDMRTAGKLGAPAETCHSCQVVQSVSLQSLQSTRTGGNPLPPPHHSIKRSVMQGSIYGKQIPTHLAQRRLVWQLCKVHTPHVSTLSDNVAPPYYDRDTKGFLNPRWLLTAFFWAVPAKTERRSACQR